MSFALPCLVGILVLPDRAFLLVNQFAEGVYLNSVSIPDDVYEVN